MGKQQRWTDDDLRKKGYDNTGERIRSLTTTNTNIKSTKDKKAVKRAEAKELTSLKGLLRIFNIPFEEEVLLWKPIGRKYRADLFFPQANLIVEYDGLKPGGKSRHTTFTGFTEDCNKLNSAVLLGYRHLRYTQGNHKKAFKEITQIIGFEIGEK